MNHATIEAAAYIFERESGRILSDEEGVIVASSEYSSLSENEVQARLEDYILLESKLLIHL